MSLFSTLYTRAVSKKALARAGKIAQVASEQSQDLQTLADAELAQRFQALRELSADARRAPGAALVREAARRALGTPHYLVQLQGGLVLLERKVSQMRTGEGKTLTITLPAAMLALERKGVHVVTANEYLAQRDASLMRPVYESLGLTVGVTLSSMSREEKAAAYACDITYGVGSEFGFDYLKDNLVREATSVAQRPLFAAIVDEVDSILIDEARVPLIIADTSANTADMARAIDQCVKTLSPDTHFIVNLKERTADLTEEGYHAAEQALVRQGHFATEGALYEAANLPWVRRLHSAVKAYALYRRNRDYVVEGGQVVLVDIGTGRSLPGRRLEDGLHEALEAREGVDIKQGSVTRATITYQSYFGLYEHLSGLTGTAATDADEFAELYNLSVIVIPTNKPPARSEREDLVFLTKAQKFQAAVELAKERSAAGQPVLMGCASIRDAELLDALLTKAGVAHNTLTAKHVEREAHIIAEAGRPGTVTVATNMAGRGTDILLGGEPPKQADFDSTEAFEQAKAAWAERRAQVLAAGGLFVLGTERNGLRRVDHQLAGRSGRQGDPGEVQFLLSLEDELLRVFGASSQLAFLRKMLEASGQALGGSAVAKLVVTAQQNVEGQGFAARKALLKYDSVLADQRNAVYALRKGLLRGGARDHILSSASAALEHWVRLEMPEGSFTENWNAGALKKQLALQFGLDLPLLRWISVDELDAEDIASKVLEAGQQRLLSQSLDEDSARHLMLDILDEAWTEHLGMLRELQDNAGLKGNTGLNPTFQFNKEAFELFQSFTKGLEMRAAEMVMPERALAERYAAQQVAAQVKADAQAALGRVHEALEARWVGRNEACPCGSGLRFKDCHGKL